MLALTKWLIRRATWIVWIAMLLSIVGGYYSVHLYKNLRTSFEELLPNTARSVVDLNKVANRMNSTENLAILVFSTHHKESKRFVDDLSSEIEKQLKNYISRVEYKITGEIAFFKERRALFMSVSDLLKVRNYVRDRIDYEKDIRNPLNIFAETKLSEPELDFDKLTRKYNDKVPDYIRFPDGYYASRDQNIRVVLAYVAGRALGIENAMALREGVDRIIHQLNPKSYADDIQIKFTGDVQNLLEERASLIADLEESTIIVAILVTFAMLVFYRNIRATSALVLSLFAGTLWTFGVSYFMVGYLNANSAFLGSIVLGNGINFGIVYLARYLEERSMNLSHFEATHTAITRTMTGTLTAALAAGLSYGSLISTQFRGFRQFGFIGLIGMILCWIASYSVMPALLTLMERHKPLDVSGAAHHRKGLFSHGVAKLVDKFPKAIVVISVLLSLASVAAITTHKGSILEPDTSKLRDKRSMESGSGFLSHYLDIIFGRYISPIVLAPESRADAKEIARRLKQLKEEKGPSTMISNVYSIDDFVPKYQRRKIEILREIKSNLRPEFLQYLSKRDRKIAFEFLRPAVFHPFGIPDLPWLVRARFEEGDGSLGKVVLVEPINDEYKLHEINHQVHFLNELHQVADAVEPGTPIVGQLPVTVDIFYSVSRDGPRATALAFAAVVLLVIILFRHARTIFQCLLALGLGVIWLAGVVMEWNLKINFLNFIALPITFGIGVDYGVNIFQRYRIEGRGSILKIVATTGGAVSLASLTTMIGYGSLLLAGNRAFFTFGRLAVLGEVCCLLAAIFSLPAYIRHREIRWEQKEQLRLKLEQQEAAKERPKAA
jgi:predicted RND superfamily exporter protein